MPTMQQRDSPPQWLRDTVDITILAAVLLAMTLAVVL